MKLQIAHNCTSYNFLMHYIKPHIFVSAYNQGSSNPDVKDPSLFEAIDQLALAFSSGYVIMLICKL